MIEPKNYIIEARNLCNSKTIREPDCFNKNDDWYDYISLYLNSHSESNDSLLDQDKIINWKNQYLNQIKNINQIPKRNKGIEQNINIRSYLSITQFLSTKFSLNSSMINSPQSILIAKFLEKLKVSSNDSLINFTYETINSIIAKQIINEISSCYSKENISISYFNKIKIVKKAELIKHISELLNDNIKDILYKIVMLSRDSEDITTAASNAITILNRNKYTFKNKNLDKVRIKGADLSFGRFENVKFESSDLRGVNFSNSSLLRVNFKNCNMENAYFGQAICINYSESIKHLEISPSGKYLIALCNGSSLIDLWDTITFRLAMRFEGSKNDVLNVFIRSDELILISTDAEYNIFIWSLVSKENIEKINLGSFIDIAFSPCGQYIVTLNKLYSAEFFNLVKKTQEIVQYKNTICEMKFSPQGTYFLALTCNFSYNIDLYSLKNKWHKVLNVRARPKFFVFSPCEKFIICELNKQLIVWNISEFGYSLVYSSYQKIEGLWVMNDKWILLSRHFIEIIQTDTLTSRKHWLNDKAVSSIAISPHSKNIYTSSKDGVINVSPLNEYEFNFWEINNYEIRAVDFSPDSKFFASTCTEIILWDIKTFLPIKTSSRRHFYTIKAIKFTSCGDFIISLSEDKIVMWNIKNLDVFNELELDMECAGISGFYLASSQKFAVFQNGVTIYMIDFECVELIQIMIFNTSYVQYMNLWVSEVSEDVIKAFWINKNAILTIYPDNTYKNDRIDVGGIADFGTISPCGEYIIFSYNNKFLVRWSIKEMKILAEDNCFDKPSMVIYSHNGNYIAMDHNNKIIIRNAKNLEIIQECFNHQGTITCISFSYKEDLFMSGSDDGTIKWWRINPSSKSKTSFVPRSKFLSNEKPIVIF